MSSAPPCPRVVQQIAWARRDWHLCTQHAVGPPLPTLPIAYVVVAQLDGRYCIGSTGVDPLRISKCSCGDDTLPVWPDFAITWPRRTESLRLTISSLACA